MDFKIANSSESNRTKTLEKASATVIEAGDMVALAAGLAVKATAGSTSIAFCEGGAAAGETEVIVSVDPSLELSGTADTNFAVTNRGAECDLVVNTGNQEIDLGASTTNVLKVLPSIDAGTVGASTDVRVVINMPIL